MARVQQDKSYNNFGTGFVTEATGLSYPANSCQDIDNCVIELKGTVKRRRGLLSESATSFSPAANYYSSAYADSRFKWRNPAGVNNLDFEVVKIGRYIRFFVDANQYTSGFKSFSIDLNTYKVAGATTANVEQEDVDIDAGKGKLLIVGKYIEPLLINYTSGTDSIAVTQLNLMERDLEGVVDGLAVDEYSAITTTAHLYNLHNQGWTDANINIYRAAFGGEYPANSEIESLGYYTSGGGTRAWQAAQVRTFPSNAPAAKGHITRKVFDTTTSFTVLLTNTVSTWTRVDNGATWTVTITTTSPHGYANGDSVTITGNSFTYTDATSPPDMNGSLNGTYVISGVTASTFQFTFTEPATFIAFVNQYVAKGSTSDTVTVSQGTAETFRCSSVAFFAGRAWFAGTESNRIGDVLHFTQVIEFDDQFAKCHQINDPTAEDFNDLIDTDGGTIKIQGLGLVRKLLPAGDFLVVFTSTGIWAVGPGDKGGFTATAFSVRKLNSPGCSSKKSVVVAEGTPLVWSSAGILAIVEDQVSGFLTAKNLTSQSIQSFYNALGSAINDPIGVYDENQKRALWLYRDSTSVYSKLLIFSLLTTAFYKWSLPVSGSVVPVLISTVQSFVPDENKVKIAYRDVVAGNSVYFWSEFDATDFYDFTGSTIGATDYSSYILTAHELLADLQRNKQATYLHSFFKRTETGFTMVGGQLLADNPSGCTVIGKWDWQNTGSGGRWTDSQRAYRYRRPYFPVDETDSFDTGEEIVYTRLKLRGKGRALAIQYNSEAGKDFQLLGYSIPFTAAGVG